MRDNARRLLTILTVILALWLALGFWPLSIGNQVIVSLCILLVSSCKSAIYCKCISGNCCRTLALCISDIRILG